MDPWALFMGVLWPYYPLVWPYVVEGVPGLTWALGPKGFWATGPTQAYDSTPTEVYLGHLMHLPHSERKPK